MISTVLQGADGQPIPSEAVVVIIPPGKTWRVARRKSNRTKRVDLTVDRDEILYVNGTRQP